MGSNQYEIKVAVKTSGDDDVKKLGQDLDAIGKITSFKKLGDQIAYSRQKYIDAQMDVERLADEMANAEKPTKALTRQFEQAESRVVKLASAHQNSVASYKNAGMALSGMGIDVKNLDGEMDRLSLSSDQLKTSISNTLKADTAKGLLDVRPYKDVRAEMEQLRNAYRYLKESGKLTDTELAQAKTVLKDKTAALVRETNSWVGVMSKAEQMNNARGLLDVRPYKDVQAEIKRLHDAYDTLKNSGQLSAKEIYKAQTQLKQKTAELTESTNGWGKSITDAKAGWIGLAGAGYAALKSFGAYSEYTQKMAAVNTVVGQSAEAHKALSNEILNLSTKIPQTASELAAAEYDIVSSGVALEDSTRVLEQAANAAIAGITDTKTAATVGVGVLNAYGKGVGELGHVYDTLFVAVREGVTTFPELAQHMGEVLPTARSAGVAFEDVSAAIAAMTLSGIRTPQAATALKGAINAMAAPAPEAKKKFEELGITWAGLIPTLEKIREKSLTIDQMRELIPDMEARTGVLALTQNMGKLNKILGNVHESSGAMKKAFDLMKDTPENQIKLFKNELNKLNIEAGGLLSLLGMPFVKALGGIAKGMNEADVFTKGLVIAFSSAGGVFVLWKLGLDKIVFGLKGMILNAREAAVANGTLVTSLTGPQGIVTAAGKASLAMKVSMAASAAYASYEIYNLVKACGELWDATGKLSQAQDHKNKLDSRAAEELKKVADSLGIQVKTYDELFELEKKGIIQYDQTAAAWVKVSAAAQGAKQTEDEIARSRVTNHESFMASIATQADVAIAKTKTQVDAQILTEKAGADQILGYNLAKYQQLLAAAEQHVTDVGRIEGTNSENYKSAVEGQKKAAQGLKEYKVQAAKEITDRLKAELNTQLGDEKRIQGEIAALHQKASDQLVLKEDELREIRRRGMTDVQQQADLEKQANEKLLAAKDALAKGDYERASNLASQSKDISKGLKDEGEAIAGVKDAWGVLEDVTKGQESAKQDELKKTQEATKRLKDEIVTVEKAVTAIAEAFKSVNLQLAAEPIKPKLDDSELKKGLAEHAELDGKHTESEHVIHFKGEGSEEKPISEKIKDLKALLAQYRQAAAEGATSVTQFLGKNTDGEKGLTETIKDLEQQIADLQAQIKTPVELTVDTTKAEASIEKVKASQTDDEKKTAADKNAKDAEGTGLIEGRDIDDSKHRPEKNEDAYAVDESLAQQIDNKKTEMSLYQQAAESSAKSGDGLYTVYVNRVNELFNQIQALEREMEEKKKKAQKTSSGTGTMRLNSGGYVPGIGSTDSVPAMLTPREFVQPAPTVRMYGADYMEALRRRRISVAAVRAQMSGAMFNSGGLVRAQSSFRVPSLPDIRPMGFNAGGMVPAAGGAGQVLERIQVDLSWGGNVYSGLFKKSEARGMIEELKRAKARSL